jgi:hypothetical protein
MIVYILCFVAGMVVEAIGLMMVFSLCHAAADKNN